MKILKKSFVGRAQMSQGALIAFLLTGLVVRSEATIYTLTSSPSVVTFDTSSGLTGWQENGGANQLSLQSLYYSVGGGAVSALTGPAVVTHGANGLTATYTVAGVVTVADAITVNGNTLGEQIKFTNLSGSASTISIFQYSDFILGSAPGSQTLNMTVINSTQASANQSGGGAALQWLGQLTGGAVEVQANGSGAPFGPFNGSATSLNNTTLSASGTAVFGYEFDGSLAPSNSLTISETAALTVPEPSSVALICSGMIALALLNRRRRGA